MTPQKKKFLEKKCSKNKTVAELLHFTVMANKKSKSKIK